MSLGPQVDRARDAWLGLTPDRRRIIGIAAAAAAAAVVAALAITAYVPYTTVYTNLTPSAAGQVVSALQTLKVPYRLSGTTIQVPAAEADQVRVELATQNLPQQGEIGYQNVLTSSGFGMTDEQFNLAVLNALQNDLAATISTMQGIRSADVQIVEPPQSAFAQAPTGGASASVYVNVAAGQSLPASEVSGIEQLVAHAVQGLNASGVAVVDQSGQLLSALASGGASASGVSGELATEHSVENALDQRITSLLTPVTGPGNVVVAVHANLSFAHTNKTENLATQSGPGGVVTSKTTSTSTFKGSGGATPAAGTSSNVPTYAVGGSTGTSNQTSKSTTVQYAVNHILEQISSPPMTVRSLTVSIMVNQKAYPLTAATTAQLRGLVATAIGLPSNSPLAKSDISVAGAPFAAVPIPTVPSPTSTPSLPQLAGAGGGALLLLIVLLLMMTRRRGDKRRGRDAARPEATAQAAAPVLLAAPAPDPNVEHERRLIEAVSESARSQPEEVANLLRGWLREEP